MAKSTKRNQLLEVAIEHFNRHGYQASGIDTILEAAGISKMTLYRHFPSKEDLIVTALRTVDDRFREDMRRVVDQLADDPKDKLLATFAYLSTWFGDTDFFGCPFLGAAGEYKDRSTAVFREVSMHKRLMVAYFEELARAAQLRDPKAVAEHICVLHEGATVMAHVMGDVSVAKRAKEVARRIIISEAAA